MCADILCVHLVQRVDLKKGYTSGYTITDRGHVHITARFSSLVNRVCLWKGALISVNYQGELHTCVRAQVSTASPIADSQYQQCQPGISHGSAQPFSNLHLAYTHHPTHCDLMPIRTCPLTPAILCLTTPLALPT